MNVCKIQDSEWFIYNISVTRVVGLDAKHFFLLLIDS